MRHRRVLVVFGTRPEAIKMAPVLRQLQQTPGIEAQLCVTGQHRQMLDSVLDAFALTPDYDLNIMKPAQDLSDITSTILLAMRPVLAQAMPDLVLVHGDTTTSVAAALAATYARITVGHVEAGLRTYRRDAPWPEEINRCLNTQLASLHFAPTPGARDNLLREGIAPETIHVTGNTVIDALHAMDARLTSDVSLRTRFDAEFSMLDSSKKLLLVTGHRRENMGEGFLQICEALRQLAARGDCEIVYPVHLNPQVHSVVHRQIGAVAGIHLIPPQDYLPFIYLMRRAYFILTDSGGIQEEAPALGKPVLVMRETSERPEAIAAGTALLVGTHTARVVAAARTLLEDEATYRAMAQAKNPFGDGTAATQIARLVLTC
jgi:UDP-N-acetylglucosamine 2-epimerase (non-hydrolysing)